MCLDTYYNHLKSRHISKKQRSYNFVHVWISIRDPRLIKFSRQDTPKASNRMFGVVLSKNGHVSLEAISSCLCVILTNWMWKYSCKQTRSKSCLCNPPLSCVDVNPNMLTIYILYINVETSQTCMQTRNQTRC